MKANDNINRLRRSRRAKSPLRDSQRLRLGQRFGNYRIRRLLASGGQAHVYLAKHVSLDKIVAIKILRKGHCDINIKEFRREAYIASKFKHPHIISIIDFARRGHVQYLVMEYASKGSLHHLHPPGSHLTSKEVLRYVDQLADAVQYIHDKGYVHGDIKAENLLLNSHDELLLSDFGIARAAKSRIANDVVQGTLSHMAPELLQGESPSIESDLYAMAITIYEWLYGGLPFQGTRDALIDQHLNTLPPSRAALRPDVPRAVEDVLFKALAKYPRQRYRNVQAFSRALHAAFEQPANRAPAPRRPTRTLRPVQRIRPTRPTRNMNTPGQARLGVQHTDHLTIWRQIASCLAIDLLISTGLACVLVIVGVSPILSEWMVSLCLILLPFIDAFIQRNRPLFFLTCCITVVASVPALLAHSLITFIVAYVGLLLLSLCTTLTVSIGNR